MSPGRGAVRVTVDRQACEANAICEGIAPEIFRVDEDDTLHIVAQPGPELAGKVRQAVLSCPKIALALADDAR